MCVFRLHPRHTATVAASIKIAAAITSAVSEFSLTYGELTSILASQRAGWAKHQVRDEREKLEVICDCGETHPGRVISDGNQLEWVCPKTGETKRDVNA